VITWRHHNGDRCTSTFVDLVPDRRIMFTYGWERSDVGIPPGSTTVEIELRPRAGGTHLHLVRRGLPEAMVEPHTGGWANSLARLGAVAAGHDPGPLCSPRSGCHLLVICWMQSGTYRTHERTRGRHRVLATRHPAARPAGCEQVDDDGLSLSASAR
jgi:hypothetical protein